MIDSVYSGISPQKGYSGDEDQGLMGSLAVLLKIGLFSTDGGTAQRKLHPQTSVTVLPGSGGSRIRKDGSGRRYAGIPENRPQNHVFAG